MFWAVLQIDFMEKWIDSYQCVPSSKYECLRYYAFIAWQTCLHDGSGEKRQLKSQAKINIGFHIFRPRLIESSLQGLLTFQHFCVVCDVMHREISCHAPKTKMFLETLFFGTRYYVVRDSHCATFVQNLK